MVMVSGDGDGEWWWCELWRLLFEEKYEERI